MTKKKIFFLFLCSLLSASVAFSTNATLNSQAEKLKNLDKQISATQSTIDNTKQKQMELQQQLQTSEVAIGQLSKNLNQLSSQIKPFNEQINHLMQQQQRYEQQLAQQQKALAMQLQYAYMHQESSAAKILLNQEDIQKISRLLAYYRFYNESRLLLIQQVSTTLTQLKTLQAQIQEKKTSLQTLQQQKIIQQKNLIAVRDQRKKVIISLDKNIEKQNQKLQLLLANKKALQSLVDNLRQKSLAGFTPVSGPFNQLRGRLPWPTRGQITQNYGSYQGIQSLPLQGVFISAPVGQTIFAPAAGKVIYADWLKGFGLLMIIDHGGGYMTLYAHCNSLISGVGDTVSSGTAIATVGDSGGLSKSGLLFQVRYQGEPQNPRRWCKRG